MMMDAFGNSLEDQSYYDVEYGEYYSYNAYYGSYYYSSGSSAEGGAVAGVVVALCCVISCSCWYCKKK